MKIVVSIALCLLIAVGAQAQSAKKFTSLADLGTHFAEAEEAAMKKVAMDRLAALEAYVADTATQSNKDLGAARIEAAGIALEAEKLDVAKRLAEAAAKDSDAATALAGRTIVMTVAARTETAAPALKETYTKFMADLPATEISPGVEATGAVAQRMIELDDIAGAKAVWAVLGAKFAHPQLKTMVENEVKGLEAIGSDPKAFSVKDLADKDLSLEQYKGKVVLLDFWATWCGPCVRELPHVIAAHKKFNSKGFEVVAISLDRDRAALDKFLAARPEMKWQQHHDTKGEVANLYDVKSIPATWLIDQNGKIYRAGLRGKALEKAIETLLARPASAPTKE